MHNLQKSSFLFHLKNRILREMQTPTVNVCEVYESELISFFFINSALIEFREKKMPQDIASEICHLHDVYVCELNERNDVTTL